MKIIKIVMRKWRIWRRRRSRKLMINNRLNNDLRINKKEVNITRVCNNKRKKIITPMKIMIMGIKNLTKFT